MVWYNYYLFIPIYSYLFTFNFINIYLLLIMILFYSKFIHYYFNFALFSSILSKKQNLIIFQLNILIKIGAQPCESGAPTHHYYVTPGSRQPIVLLVTDIYEEWWFTSSFIKGPQKSNLFDVPSICFQNENNILKI